MTIHALTPIIDMCHQSDTRTVAQDEAGLSELIEKARQLGSQAITRNGECAVVVVGAALWGRIFRREQPGSFIDFLRASPLRGSGLEVERLPGGLREAEP